MLALTMLTAAADNPVAQPANTVTDGNARFTILTPEMIRIEYNDSGKFEDRATFMAVNRDLGPVSFGIANSDGNLIINTDALKLVYRKGTDARLAENLSIEMLKDPKRTVWHPGMPDTLNLKGTYRTLDHNNADSHRKLLENGVISRAGWAVVDDSPAATRADGSRSLLFDKVVDDIPWVASRPVDDSMDIYFMGYGHDYKRAVSDYTRLAGRVPLPPRFVFGYWYSKYDAYSSQDFRDIAQSLIDNDINTDVMIIDMDWHYNGREESGGRGGWTGWTWNPNLIPDPDSLLSDMHTMGMRVALNLHPATGVMPDEDIFEAMRAEVQPDSAADRKIDWALQDSTFYRSFFKHFVHNEERRGVDFWWIDWQQTLVNPKMSGMGETFWCNHVFFNDMAKHRDRRPVIFHRWGGLGSHRYQIGFSGDTYINYPTLAFQPYFTATASNVGYGYWGHDLGGHMMLNTEQDPNDPELVLRWVQYGVFTPIFRTHATRDSRIERRIWKYPNFDQLNKAVKLRYAMMPYIYTMARKCYDTGISITRPLYYEYPELDEAYKYDTEYFFGDDILVAPISEKGVDGVVAQDIWLPEGNWYSPSHNRMIEGGKVITENFDHTQYPWFVRNGAIIINNPPELTRAANESANLIVNIYGTTPGSTTLYEDQGDSRDYDTAYATTRFSHQGDSKRHTVNVAPREGSYPGMHEQRGLTVNIHDTPQPAKVSSGKQNLAVSYDAQTRITTVNVPQYNPATGLNIDIRYK